MEKLFRLKENGTTVRTEILAGLTTFMTMAYIIALTPNLLTNFAVGTPLAVVTPGQWWSYIQIGNTYGYMMNEFIGNYSQQLPSPATQTDLY